MTVQIQQPSQLSNRKQRKKQERALREAAARRQLIQRISLWAAPVVLLILLVVGYVVIRASQDSRPPDMFSFESDSPTGVGVAWSPDGKSVAFTDSEHHTVDIWDTTTRKRLHQLSGQWTAVHDITWSSTRDLLAIAVTSPTSPMQMELWSTTDWRRVSLHNLPSSAGKMLRRVAFAPSGRTLALTTESALLLEAVDPWRELARIPLLSSPNAAAGTLAWSPQGTTLAVNVDATYGQENTALSLVDGATLKTQRSLALPGQFPTNIIGAATWSPDGTQVALANLGGAVTMYDARSGKPLRVLDAAMPSINTLDWSSDGKQLAAGGNNGVAIWNVQTGHVLQQEDAPVDLPHVKGAALNTVLRIVWSPDAKKIAISGNQAIPRLWLPKPL